jgi:hypothetical protein
MKKNLFFSIVMLAATALMFSACSLPSQPERSSEETISQEVPIPGAEESSENIPMEEPLDDIPEGNSDDAMVGNDRDENGCIASAGYTWCEPKGKCLRLWEEECYSSVEEELEYILAEKHSRLKEETKVTISKRSADGNYLSGGVMFGAGGPGEGGMLLAAKVDDVWQVVFDGNGTPDCEQLRTEFNFPDEILKPNFCD